jgi:hypothetical protein
MCSSTVGDTNVTVPVTPSHITISIRYHSPFTRRSARPDLTRHALVCERITSNRYRSVPFLLVSSYNLLQLLLSSNTDAIASPGPAIPRPVAFSRTVTFPASFHILFLDTFLYYIATRRLVTGSRSMRLIMYLLPFPA